MRILISHVVLGGGEADVQVAGADACSLQGMDSQAGRPQVIEGQHNKATRLASCVQRPDLTIRLHMFTTGLSRVIMYAIAYEYHLQQQTI
jgi:hypothetical protein